MPTYTVTDPQSGRTLRLTGNSPPTEQELTQIFATTQPKKSVGGFANNVVKSTGNLIKDTAGALINVVNPDMEKNTLANLARLGASIVSVALPGEQGNEELARKVGEFYINRYGGLDKAWNSFYNDPAGVAADLSVVLGGAGTAIKGLGTVSKVGKLAKAGEIVSKAGRLVDPLNVVSKTELLGKTPSLGNVFKRVGSKLELAGENIATKGLGSDVKLEEMAARSGKTPAQFIEKYNLYDRTPQSAMSTSKAIWDKYYQSAVNSGKKIPISEVVKSIDDEVAKLSELPEQARSRNTLATIEELQNRKQGLLAMAGDSAELTPEQAIRFRQELDKDIPKSMFTLDAKGSGSATGTKQTRDILRSKINSLSPETAELGLDYGTSKQIEKTFRRYQTRNKNKQFINFGTVTKAGVGGVVGGIPGAVAGYATDAITNDPRFLKVASKTLKTAGSAVKNAKMPKVPSYANTAFKAAKTVRTLTPQGSSTQPKKSQTVQGVMFPKVSLSPQTNSISKSNSSYPSVASPKLKPFKLKIRR